MPMPSLLEATTSICSPKEEAQVPMALPAVAASQVAPAGSSSPEKPAHARCRWCR